MRNVLDGEWCVKKKRCRIGGVNSYFYIRGNWIDIENLRENLSENAYRKIKEEYSIDIYNKKRKPFRFP